MPFGKTRGQTEVRQRYALTRKAFEAAPGSP